MLVKVAFGKVLIGIITPSDANAVTDAHFLTMRIQAIVLQVRIGPE